MYVPWHSGLGFRPSERLYDGKELNSKLKCNLAREAWDATSFEFFGQQQANAFACWDDTDVEKSESDSKGKGT